MKGFKVLHGGLFTTIQDQGRYGYNHLGITHSGAMDEYAYLWSQKLLDNNNANALEVMVGLKLEVQIATTMALCGADLNFKINGTVQKNWQTHLLKVGDILTFDRRISGQRAYLAVKGGFQLPKTYGSYASTLKENIGKRLQKEDILTYSPVIRKETKRVAQQYVPNYTTPLTLRVLPSYQNDYFNQEEQNKFFNSDYTITLESNRMGSKLKGTAIIPNKGGIVSEGISFGSIQIPKNGQPILLLKEKQTIGGYPKIGTVLEVDCFKFSQLSIGDTVRFEKINFEIAREKMLNFIHPFS